MKGTIALDIDGTLTDHCREIPEPVCHKLRELHLEGWRLAFVTGRTFRHGRGALSLLDFPHCFAVQNGALLLDMPKHEVLKRHYLNREDLKLVTETAKQYSSLFAVYPGYEDDDRVYYCPDKMTGHEVDYLRTRCASFQEELIPLNSFDQLARETFASIKFFGPKESMESLSEGLGLQGMDAPVIRDPFRWENSVLQCTSKGVNKGQVIRDLRMDSPQIIIAAGDDWNDLSMLEEADLSIAMETAPEELKKKAHYIAPSVQELGILKGLEWALKQIA